MITINAETKIASILKAHPDALDTIVSISPKFGKLRNPLLRKVMAPRTSINTASKIGGCTVDIFFQKLEALGFTIENISVPEVTVSTDSRPEFMKTADDSSMLELDVRPVIESGKDPLQLILKTLKELKPLQILKLVNSFEPAPLIQLLGKKGFESYAEVAGHDLVITYFYNPENSSVTEIENAFNGNDWDELLQQYEGSLVNIDVRTMEMPMPMITILESLEKLTSGKALFVQHKKVPVFLLPELTEKKFDYRIKEIGENEVYMLIFKP